MKDNETQDYAVAGSSVHVGGKGGGGRKKLLVLIFVVVLVVAGGVGAAWYLWQRKHSAGQKLDPITQANVDAQKFTLSGDYKKAHQAINQGLDDPKLSTEAKQTLYIQEAVTYENQKKYDKAMESYRKAEKLGLTAGIAQSIAFLAIKMKNNELALEYFKKTIPLLPKDGPLAEENIKYFQNWVIHLEGGEPKT